MPYVNIDTEVWIEPDVFTTEELLAVLEERRQERIADLGVENTALQVYYKRSQGQDYQVELDNLIYTLTGRF
jgi:hypothetical protein